MVNTSATLPAELDGRRSGKPVVVHLATDLGDGTWVAELRSAPERRHPGAGRRGRRRGPAAGAGPDATGGALPTSRFQPHRVGEPALAGAGRPGRQRPSGSALAYLYRHGRPIAYGYLRDRYPTGRLSDNVRHTIPAAPKCPARQGHSVTIWSTRLVAAGVPIAPITLHTGVSSQDVGEAPQAEWFEVPAPTAGLVASTPGPGGRVIAVGTTVTRALESAVGADGTIAASSGWTELVIDPCRGVRVVDGLITGWHNPEASHLLLVEAVVGAAVTQRAYDAAVAEGYLWHEFGDAGLLLETLTGRS